MALLPFLTARNEKKDHAVGEATREKVQGQHQLLPRLDHLQQVGEVSSPLVAPWVLRQQEEVFPFQGEHYSVCKSCIRPTFKVLFCRQLHQ